MEEKEEVKKNRKKIKIGRPVTLGREAAGGCVDDGERDDSDEDFDVHVKSAYEGCLDSDDELDDGDEAWRRR